MSDRVVRVVLALIVLALSVFLVSAKSPRLGLDLRGGTQIVLETRDSVTVRADHESTGQTLEVLRRRVDALGVSEPAIADVGFPRAVVQSSGTGDLTVRTPNLSNDQETRIRAAVAGLGGQTTKIRDEFIGPSLGDELRSKALIALGVALAVQLLYLSARFRPAFGVAAVTAMAHDVIILVGAFAWLGKTVDGVFLAALLTVIGYSVNDTVVVFDRVRERWAAAARMVPFAQVVNRALVQTLPRTVNTGLGAVFILCALAVLGGNSLTDFAIALLIGIAVGTYSSMFTAAPIAIELHARSNDPPSRPTGNATTKTGSTRPRTGGRAMRSPSLAVMAVSAGLVCGACATGADSAPGTAARSPDYHAPATGDAGQAAEPFVLARNLAVPWAIAFLPDGDALVTERDSARLLRVTPHGKVSTVGTVPGVDPYGEGGLLGIAVSPSFRQDRLVYVYFSTATDNRIARFRYSDGLIGPLDAVVSGIPRAAIHNGGRLAFGPDDMLWASTGEHGEPGLAQDRDSLGGKILRMTPDGRPAPGNPFGTLVWSYGHRNVEGMAWDAAGRMYATEFGQDRFDEINRIEKGRNYGWPAIEGAAGRGGYTDPEITWPPDQASPSGAAIAGGSLWVATLRGERLWQIPLGRTGAVGVPVAHFTGNYGRLREVVRAPDGSLWCTTSNRDGRGNPRPGDDKILVIPVRAGLCPRLSGSLAHRSQSTPAMGGLRAVRHDDPAPVTGHRAARRWLTMAGMPLKQQTARALRNVAWRIERPSNSRRRDPAPSQDVGALARTDSAPGSRTASWFFEQFPRFYRTSYSGATAVRLNLRYEAIFGENRDIFAGASVLDLASHDGRWSLAALATGARSVTGIEARPELVKAAAKNLAKYGYGADRVRFITGDVHQVLNTQDCEANVVLCLGFLYHTLRYTELLNGIRRTNARYLIIDTFSPYMMGPVPNVNVITEDADQQGSAAADTYTRGPSALVGRPNLAAIQTMLEAYGYRVERHSDWAGLLRDNPTTEDFADYANKRRITLRCVSANAAPGRANA